MSHPDGALCATGVQHIYLIHINVSNTSQRGGLCDAKVLVRVLLDAVSPLPPHHDPVLELLQQIMVEELQKF